VVKRSRNPYANFQSSMAEMVAGRRIRSADALSELLVWYLFQETDRLDQFGLLRWTRGGLGWLPSR
jgi:uncharacterized protein (TIGR01568 family)